MIAERCIACGNCVRVCSQNAKLLRSTAHEVHDLLASGGDVVACLAPSFPAEFIDMHHTQMIGMLRKLGFQRVVEVSFGADLVARQYWELLLSCGEQPLHLHDMPRDRDVRRTLLSGPRAVPGADRVAHDCHRPRRTRDLRQGSQGGVHRALHRQEDGGQGRVGHGRDRRRHHFLRAARTVQRGGHRSGPRGDERLRPAPRFGRRPVSHQPRRPAGGQSPRRSAHRRNRGHAGPQPYRGSDQGVCRGRLWRKTPGSALLRRLHHGRRADERPAHVQSPPPRADLRQRADEDLRPRRWQYDIQEMSRLDLSRSYRANDQRIPAAGPRRGRGDHAPHGQAPARPTS